MTLTSVLTLPRAVFSLAMSHCHFWHHASGFIGVEINGYSSELCSK